MKRILLLVVFGLALFLRFWGIWPSYPPYHPDEGISYSAAVSMIKDNTLDPLRYDYPSVVPLVNYISFKVIFIPVSWLFFYLRHIGDFVDGIIQFPLSISETKRIFQLEILGDRELYALMWGRITTAFVSFGSVVFVFFVGKKLGGWWTGLFSTLLLTINYRSVLNAHIGLPDTYNAFFLLLAFYCILLFISKRSFRNLALCGVTCGLSLGVKYQPFALIIFIFAYFCLLRPFSLRSFFRNITNFRFLFVIVLAITVFLALNPYAFIKYEETREWLTSVSGKYRTGRFEFDFYPISYLYHYGIGKSTFITLLIGMMYSLIKRRLSMVFSLVLLFFYVTVYYSGAGFYTRNFVSISPFLFLFGGFLLSRFLQKGYFTFLLLPLIGILFFENYSNSFILSREYSRSWNYQVFSSNSSKFFPSGSHIAAHSSVPFSDNSIIRNSYEFDDSFSLQEFENQGSQFSVANLDWETNDFYWWMTQNTTRSLSFWNKPVSILKQSYPSLALTEQSYFSMFTVMKPWQSPDSNFLVSVVPHNKLLASSLFKRYDFRDGDEGFLVKSYSSDLSSGIWNHALYLRSGYPTFPDLRWESQPFDVSLWQGFALKAIIQTDSLKKKNDGFIFIKF
jgi:4-amino-4-deoxy-L-arabinose transferase-like glycosyltransferase